MTIEERAREYAARIPGAGDIWDKVVEQIEAALREQIEECEGIADRVRRRELEMYTGLNPYYTIAEEIRDKIRALADNPLALPLP